MIGGSTGGETGPAHPVLACDRQGSAADHGPERISRVCPRTFYCSGAGCAACRRCGVLLMCRTFPTCEEVERRHEAHRRGNRLRGGRTCRLSKRTSPTMVERRHARRTAVSSGCSRLTDSVSNCGRWRPFFRLRLHHANAAGVDIETALDRVWLEGVRKRLGGGPDPCRHWPSPSRSSGERRWGQLSTFLRGST